MRTDDEAVAVANATARQLSRLPIGPGASEGKGYQVAGMLLDLLIELARFCNALEEGDADWRPVVSSIVKKYVKKVEELRCGSRGYLLSEWPSTS
jgi:hypothetical protein